MALSELARVLHRGEVCREWWGAVPICKPLSLIFYLALGLLPDEKKGGNITANPQVKLQLLKRHSFIFFFFL